MMALRRVSVLVATASLLMMFQCCQHVCICDDVEFMGEDDDDLLLEIEEEGEEAVVDVFEPTHEWKTVRDGQAVPPGLHIRMNLETGQRQAKLLSETNTDNSAKESGTTQGKEDETLTGTYAKTPQQKPSNKKLPTDTGQQREAVNSKDTTFSHPGFLFKGDQRRTHHYGHSDRRGIINKRRRVFSQKEVAEMLKKMEESTVDLSKLPGIAYSQPTAEDIKKQQPNQKSPLSQKKEKKSSDVKITHLDPEPAMERPMHPELAQMMEHARTLTRQAATVPELLQALEELEYHVHHIENAKDLNSIGGMVLVVRLLNHSHPEVRSSAAQVIGAATQSNPQVQSEALDYGALELLCLFIGSQEPELVQRRGLFALSALLRGQTQPQLTFLQQCQGLSQLGHTFHQRSTPTQLKAVTLLTDLLHEQQELLHSSDQLTSLLHKSIQDHGWCQHVPSLLHSDAQSPTEKALQAMSELQHLCDFTRHSSRLQELSRQFEEALLQEDGDEVSLSLLTHSQDLLKNIRQRNKEL